jgi:CRISPR-associated protein Cmx8
MAKAKSPPKPKGEPNSQIEIVVKYDLFDLPTAFHKAGLAGLVLLIESLKARHVLTEAEAKHEMAPTSVTVTFTNDLVQKLMDDIYDAKVVEVSVKSKWPGADLKREETVEEEIDGKKVKSKRYIYDQVQPKGSFFDNVFDAEKEIWRKLWRDMLWNITRGRPTTRIPFNERADGKPCGEGEAIWTDLLNVEKARGKNGFYTAELSSALFPGAQAVNAEGIAFEGRAEENLLLHFWTFVALLFVPNIVDTDGSSDFVGYTLAVPEVGDLVDFTEHYPRILDALKPAPRGYRPAGAIIDIAAEGGLSFLNSLAEVSGLKVEDSKLKYSIRSVEYLHLVKAGGKQRESWWKFCTLRRKLEHCL